MSEFVQLWVYLSSTPLFGLALTVVVYVLAHALYDRAARAPWANPVLWSVVVLATALHATGTAYPAYFSGAQFIHVLLGPAVVAMAWPLWQQRAALQRRWGRLMIAALAGGCAGAASAVALAWVLDLPTDMLRSLAPKSVTAPVAMGVAERIGGIPALAAVFAVLTGIVGAASGKYLFDVLRIGTDPVGWQVRGFALGTAAHGIGAARAWQVHPEAGAWASLALPVQAILAALLIPPLTALVS